MEIETSSDLNSARDFTIEEFNAYIKKFDVVSSLMSLQKLSGLMANQVAVNIHMEYEFYSSPKRKLKAAMLTRDFVSFAAKQILLNSVMGGDDYNDADLFHLIYLYNNLKIDLHEMSESGTHVEEGWLWVIRTTNQQWFYLRLQSAIMARYHWIFSRIFENNPTLGAELDNVLNIGVFNLMKIGTCIYANYCFRDDGKFADSFLMSSYTGTTIFPLRDLLQEKNILKFFDIFATIQQGFQEECKKFELANPLLKKYEFNPLKRFPVIKTDAQEENKKYIIPSLSDLVYGSFEGLYYVLLDKLDTTNKSLLFQEMGKVFEEYIGTLTKYYDLASLSLATLHSETTYHIGKDEWKSVDWLLVSDKYIFQIECKKRKIDNYSRAGIQSSDGPGIEKLIEDVASELDKLVQKEEHLKTGLVSGIDHQGKEVISIIVFLDEMFAMNQYARDKIKAKMQKQTDNFYVLGCWQYELLCQQSRNLNQGFLQSLNDVLNHKTEIFKVDFLDDVYTKFFKDTRNGK